MISCEYCWLQPIDVASIGALMEEDPSQQWGLFQVEVRLLFLHLRLDKMLKIVC